ncbi:diacylglycerol kinase theta isoform X3 [Helicoverpa armigera]|uniref:diacylglycerol kinase theta isoform X1 n=1 Tax=Helicoverpa zea TaxID=7113 RepID=UPI001F595119|nr:diacylglycerol kinase theta isoform X1 [Helicoverpa zea]XP_049693253.1 diacylglycerol kinase theta isoform X3 [Helicoverpa armigera]
MAQAAPAPHRTHSFAKKTFHKPTYCHHCSDLLWGLIGQGYGCEVCNFIVHERCVGQVVTPCCGVAPSLIKNPVAHCWSEPTHHKRKFCTVCRKRLDELPALHCMICEYYVHGECVDFAAADCKENATYCAGSEPRHVHHWREGNLPANSKCAACRRACWSAECLTGYRCEWCGSTCHAGCRALIPDDCNFGMLQPIFLPPSAVSIPRTEVPMEAIIGVHVRPPPSQRDFGCPRAGGWAPARLVTLARRLLPAACSPHGGASPPYSRARSVSEEFSSGCEGRSGSGGGSTGAPADQDHRPDHKQHRDRTPDDRDEEVVKVYDGEAAWTRRLYRPVVVGRNWNERELVAAALRAFHVARDPELFELTDALAGDEPPLKDPTPLAHVTRLPNKRPALFLRFKEPESGGGEVRVYPGRVAGAGETFVTVGCTGDDAVADLMAAALERFGLDPARAVHDYRCSEILLDRGGPVSERVLEEEERPWRIVVRLARESVRRMELARFYLQPRRDPHGPTLALFVASLPPGLSERNYENILVEFLGAENKFTSIGPIYYEYGSMVITYEDASKAVRALYALREAKYEDKHLLVMLLPSIEPSMVPAGVKPLLVFVNVKSGGCQGLELISSFRKLLNPYQVFDLENGGPLPGLYVFRHIPNYKILVCGGDGTIGWVLQCLDNVGQDSQCSNPPCAIVPLGTGNDLARTLRWGSGYTGCEDPLSLLRDVIDAEEIRLDRWTVVFHPEDKQDEPKELSKQLPASVTTGSQSEDNSQILVMNNYFGIGIDADLCLDFHNAREENPNKFNSRLRNKGVYVKMGLRKMVGRKMCKDLHKAIRLEVDGKLVELPQLEGIIILNILSWGSGANPWGPEKDDQFSKPNHWDGMLEIVGVTGVVHLGQIQSGLRGAMRIAQGGHIKINLKSEIPVQVDGEPWVAAPSEVVVLKSALKATMLKKRGKVRRRNTEPSMPRSPERPERPERAERAELRERPGDS